MLKFSIITPKRILRDSARFEPLCVNIGQRVWSLRVPKKKKINKKSHKKVTFHLFAQKSPVMIFFYQTWNKRSTGGCNQMWQILWKSVQEFKFYKRLKCHCFPIRNWRRRYNSAALPRSLWCSDLVYVSWLLLKLFCCRCKLPIFLLA